MAKINFKLVTPEKVVFEEAFDSITMDTAAGQITILPNHAPLVGNLVPGELTARRDGEEFYVYVGGGFVTVEKGSNVILLADAAEHHHEIDERKADEARRRAEKALKESVMSAEEIAETEAALARSLVQLKIARRRAHGRQSNIESIQ